MCDDNFITQAAAKALGSAISNDTKLKILKLWDKHSSDVYPIDTESAMIIIRSLCNNNTITKLGLHIALYKNYINLVTREAEFVNSIRESKMNILLTLHCSCMIYKVNGMVNTLLKRN